MVLACQYIKKKKKEKKERKEIEAAESPLNDRNIFFKRVFTPTHQRSMNEILISCDFCW
jgi:hypothetical protein